MYKLFAAVACAALLLAFFPVNANADEWNKRTIVTFSGPVEIPGKTLPAGTYVFKLLDSSSNRHVVQVFNEDETEILATILAIPDYRLKPTEKTVITFAERATNMPEALRAWFYPGDNFGHEFVYPKAEAMELAEVAKVPVPAAEITPETPPEELVETPIVTVTPEKEEVAVAEVTPAPPIEAQVAEPAPAPIAELPKTASTFPLFILVGLSALALAGVLRTIAKLT